MPDPNIAPDVGGGKARCSACGIPVCMTYDGQCLSCRYPDDCDENGLDDDPEHFEDCGLMPNGQCLKAGSEECDWECGRLR